MKKRVLGLSLILGIFLISFVSAFGHYNFGVNYFDQSIIIWGAIFIIFFAVINFILGRTIFKQDKTTRSVIALAMAVLATYGLITSNFQIGGGYIGTWEIGDFLPTIFTLAFLAGLIYLIYRFRKRFAEFLIVTGLLIILVSFTNLVYEQVAVFIIGLILLLIGLWLRRRRRRGPSPPGSGPSPGAPSPGPSPPGTPPPEERRRREKRRRAISDLKQKYDAYVYEKNQLLFKLKKKSLTAEERKRGAHKLKRMRQALDLIIKMARKQGVSQRDFLSKYGTIRKSPGEMEW